MSLVRESNYHRNNNGDSNDDDVITDLLNGTRNENLFPFRNYITDITPLDEQPRSSLKRLLCSSLPFYIFKWLIVFEINAGLWVLLLEFGVFSEPGEKVLIFSTSLDLIGFALGLIYWLWVGQGRDRMFYKAKLYELLLAAAESLARRIVQLLPKDIATVLVENSKQCKPDTQQKQPKDRTIVYAMIEEVQVLLCASAQAFTFVMLDDPINMKKPKKHGVSDLHLTTALRDELSSYTPSDELEMAESVGIMIEERIKQLQYWGVMEHDSSGVFNDVEAISKELRTVRVSREEQSYEYVNLFMISALAVVLFFFPYIIWPHAHLYTLLVYPVLMFIITGLPLTIDWYGDPFEGRAGDNAIDYRSKEKNTCNRIYESFQRYFNNSSCHLLGHQDVIFP